DMFQVAQLPHPHLHVLQVAAQNVGQQLGRGGEIARHGFKQFEELGFAWDQAHHESAFLWSKALNTEGNYLTPKTKASIFVDFRRLSKEPKSPVPGERRRGTTSKACARSC